MSNGLVIPFLSCPWHGRHNGWTPDPAGNFPTHVDGWGCDYCLLDADRPTPTRREKPQVSDEPVAGDSVLQFVRDTMSADEVQNLLSDGLTFVIRSEPKLLLCSCCHQGWEAKSFYLGVETPGGSVAIYRWLLPVEGARYRCPSCWERMKAVYDLTARKENPECD